MNIGEALELSLNDPHRLAVERAACEVVLRSLLARADVLDSQELLSAEQTRRSRDVLSFLAAWRDKLQGMCEGAVN